MRKVYVANDAGYDYTPAESFGQLELVVRFLPRHTTSLGKITEQILARIKHSTPDDYLLLSGSNLICALVTALWFEKHGQVKFLHWANNQRYEELMLDGRTSLTDQKERTTDDK